MEYRVNAWLLAAAAALIMLAGCRASGGELPAQAPAQTTPPAQTEATEASVRETEPSAPETVPEARFWPDVVELVNPAGETTTAYRLADDRYLDKADRFFAYDGGEDWICEDGSVWNMTLDQLEERPCPISVEYAIERFVAQRPDAVILTDDKSEDAVRVVFTTAEEISNFSYYSLSVTDENGQLKYGDFTPIYSCTELTPNDLMVIQLSFPGLLPNRGISFTDSTGNTVYYYITISGEYDAPILVRFP